MTLKKFILVISLCSLMYNVSAQSNRTQNSVIHNEVREEIKNSISYRGGISRVLNVLKQLPRQQQVLIFSVIVETDKSGNINKVDFTNRSLKIDSISFYSDVTKYLKEDKRKVFKKHRSSSYIVSVLIRDDDNYTIDVTSSFLKSVEELIPLTVSEKNRILVVLPFINFSVVTKQ